MSGDEKTLSEVLTALDVTPPIERQSKVFDNSGLSNPSPLFPNMGRRESISNDDDPRMDATFGTLGDQVGETHGFPLAPQDLLEAHLETFEEEENIEEAYWEQFRPDDPYGPDFEGVIDEDLPVIEEDAESDDDDSDDTKSQDDDRKVEKPLSYKELVSPLSIEEIRKRRKKERVKKAQKGVSRKYCTTLRHFIIGSPTSDEDGYDYDRALTEYEALHDDVVNGKAILGFETVKSVTGTGNFKILLKVLYPEIDDDDTEG